MIAWHRFCKNGTRAKQLNEPFVRSIKSSFNASNLLWFYFTGLGCQPVSLLSSQSLLFKFRCHPWSLWSRQTFKFRMSALRFMEQPYCLIQDVSLEVYGAAIPLNSGCQPWALMFMEQPYLWIQDVSLEVYGADIPQNSRCQPWSLWSRQA